MMDRTNNRRWYFYPTVGREICWDYGINFVMGEKKEVVYDHRVNCISTMLVTGKHRCVKRLNSRHHTVGIICKTCNTPGAPRPFSTCGPQFEIYTYTAGRMYIRM